jgi:hypothetical protein
LKKKSVNNNFCDLVYSFPQSRCKVHNQEDKKRKFRTQICLREREEEELAEPPAELEEVQVRRISS